MDATQFTVHEEVVSIETQQQETEPVEEAKGSAAKEAAQTYKSAYAQDKKRIRQIASAKKKQQLSTKKSLSLKTDEAQLDGP